MSVHFNTKAKRVTSDDIYSITLLNTVVNTSTDVNGGFLFEGYHTATGCGGVETAILITLKDNISWTRISFKWEGVGSASCWSFNDTGGYGSATGNPGGNLIAYNEAAGDRVSDSYLTWEQAAFITHNKTYACDNDANNFFRYNTGDLRRFRMTRRRNVNGSLGAIHHGRSCNNAGSTVITRISDIFIW